MRRTTTTARTISAATAKILCGGDGERQCVVEALDAHLPARSDRLAGGLRAPELTVDEDEADGIELLADDPDLPDQLLLAR